MRVNIYYGGRGLIDDPTIFVIEKMEQVLSELDVQVDRFNLYENKNGISMLPKTLKDVDGVILAASVEWLGIGGFLQQFLDSCWLYGDKEKIGTMYMLPVVMATTYGERDAEFALIRAWEMLGGIPCEGMCAYVDNPIEFETNAGYGRLVERKTEDFYRIISKHMTTFPNSNNAVKKNVLRSNTLNLTPQESEQLSQYVSNDTYVKKQKEDIEELANMFKGMLGESDVNDKYMSEFKEHFVPMNNLEAIFQIDVADENVQIVLKIKNQSLECLSGKVKNADVVIEVKADVMNEIVSGKRTVQNAFMSGDLSAQGNFKMLRNFDALFRFAKR